MTSNMDGISPEDFSIQIAHQNQQPESSLSNDEDSDLDQIFPSSPPVGRSSDNTHVSLSGSINTKSPCSGSNIVELDNLAQFLENNNQDSLHSVVPESQFANIELDTQQTSVFDKPAVSENTQLETRNDIFECPTGDQQPVILIGSSTQKFLGQSQLKIFSKEPVPLVEGFRFSQAANRSMQKFSGPQHAPIGGSHNYSASKHSSLVPSSANERQSSGDKEQMEPQQAAVPESIPNQARINTGKDSLVQKQQEIGSSIISTSKLPSLQDNISRESSTREESHGHESSMRTTLQCAKPRISAESIQTRSEANGKEHGLTERSQFCDERDPKRIKIYSAQDMTTKRQAGSAPINQTNMDHSEIHILKNSRPARKGNSNERSPPFPQEDCVPVMVPHAGSTKELSTPTNSAPANPPFKNKPVDIAQQHRRNEAHINSSNNPVRSLVKRKSSMEISQSIYEPTHKPDDSRYIDSSSIDQEYVVENGSLMKPYHSNPDMFGMDMNPRQPSLSPRQQTVLSETDRSLCGSQIQRQKTPQNFLAGGSVNSGIVKNHNIYRTDTIARSATASPAPLARRNGHFDGIVVLEWAASCIQSERVQQEETVLEQQDEIAKLEEQIGALQACINALTKEKVEMTEKSTKLESWTKKKVSDTKQIMRAQEQLKSEAAAMKKAYESVVQKLAVGKEAAKEAQEAQATMERKCKKMEEKIAAHPAAIEALHKQLEDRVYELQKERGMYIGLQKELDGYKKTKSDLESVLEEHRNAMFLHLSGHEGHIRNVLEKEAGNQERINKCLDSISAIQQDKEIQKSSPIMEEFKKAVEDLSMSIESRVKTSTNSEQDLRQAGSEVMNEIKKRVEELNANNSNLTKLNEENNKLREKNAINLEKLEAKSAKIEELTSKLTNANLTIDGFKISLTAKDEELLQARQILREDPIIRENLKKAETTIADLRVHAEEVRCQMEKAKGDLHLKEESYRLAWEQNQQLTEDLQRSRAEVGTVKADKATAIIKTKAEFEKKRAEMDTIWGERMAEHDTKLAGTINNLQHEKKEGQAQSAKLKIALTKLEEEVTGLRSEKDANASLLLNSTSKCRKLEAEIARSEFTQLAANIEKSQQVRNQIAAESFLLREKLAHFEAEQENYLNLKLATKQYLVHQGILGQDSSLNEWVKTKTQRAFQAENPQGDDRLAQLTETNSHGNSATASEMPTMPPRRRRSIPQIPPTLARQTTTSKQSVSFATQHATVTASTLDNTVSGSCAELPSDKVIPDSQGMIESTPNRLYSDRNIANRRASTRSVDMAIQDSSFVPERQSATRVSELLLPTIEGSQAQGQSGVVTTEGRQWQAVPNESQHKSSPSMKHRATVPGMGIAAKSILKGHSKPQNNNATSRTDTALPVRPSGRGFNQNPPRGLDAEQIRSIRGMVSSGTNTQVSVSKSMKTTSVWDFVVTPEKPIAELKRSRSRAQLANGTGSTFHNATKRVKTGTLKRS